MAGRDRHPRVQGRHGLAAGAEASRHFAQGLEEILVVEEKRQLHRIPAQGRALQLARGRAPARDRQVRRITASGRAAPGQTGCCRPPANCRPAIIARVMAERIGRFFTLPTMRAPACIIASKRRRAQTPTRARRAQAAFLLRLPAQHLDPACRKARARGRNRLPLHGDLDGPQHPHLLPNGRRRRALGRPGPLHRREAHLRQPRRRHLLPLRPARHPPVAGSQGTDHLQDSLQRCRGDDRRPAGSTAASASP